MGKQDLIDQFYNVDNLVTVKIDLPTWENLKAAQPRGDVGYVGHRYDWHKATSVTISGTKFPEKPATFSNVGVIKKSYFGSFDTVKPSLRIDFARFDKSQGKQVEDLIGNERITLSNCKQDPGYLRQPLVYELFRQAGVPYFCCSFAKLIVNDTEMGLYVNLEPFRKPYLKRNFDHDKGNAYEIEFGDDITAAMVNAPGHLGFEGFSDYEDKKDLNLAADLIAQEGVAGAKKAFNWDAFIRFWAMEILVKHRDGYTCHLNNSFTYNDAKIKADPTADDLNFKFIPSGVDLTLSSDPVFHMGIRAVVPKLAYTDEATMKQLNDQVKKYMDTVFSADNYSKSLGPFIQRLEDVMKAAGVEFNDALVKEIEIAKASVKAAGTDASKLHPKP